MTLGPSRPVVVRTLAIVGLTLVVWFAGPLFAFAENRPLATVSSRMIVLLACVAAWLTVVVVRRTRAAAADRQLMASVVAQSRAHDESNADVVQLRERFEQAIATITRRPGRRCRLYDMPWYAIIGPAGCGKTTALMNGGLQFPLEHRFGRPEIRGIGGTRNCEWLFTDDAVFLDTAGRFTTQDSDPSSDAGAWKEFLSLLRRWRPRQPLNGVIVAVGADDLMRDDDTRAAVAASIRRRLTELRSELRVQLPLYLVVTKCDLLAGFAEYFADLDADARRQVWGVTFPYGVLPSTALGNLPREIDALIERLQSRVLVRIHEERDVERRTRILSFPLQVASLRQAVIDCASAAFTFTTYEEPLLLRGVYLTSGTQQGIPVDRVLGGVGRRFGVNTDPVPVPPARTRAFFVDRLFRDVILAESGLAGINWRAQARTVSIRLAAAAAMIALTLGWLAALTVSYRHNRALVDRVGAAVATVPPLPPAPTSIGQELPRLDGIRAVVDLTREQDTRRPWSMRWGLYQGSGLVHASQDAYQRELDDLLLPEVASRIKQRVQQSAPEPERLYEYLKAYLMLGHPGRLDKAQLRLIADLEWPRNDSDPRNIAVTRHFAALLDRDRALRPISLDDTLVAQARSAIRQASIPVLIYRQLRLTYAADTARGLRIDRAAGVGIERVLRRKSHVPLAEPIPAIYTPAVFREITSRDAAAIVRDFADAQWVWGGEGTPPANADELASAVAAIYEDDYIAQWDRFVADWEPLPMSTLPATKEALAILAGPTSPLRGVLKVVDENTFLVAPEKTPEDRGIRDRIEDVLRRGAGRPKPAVVPGARITAHFVPLHALVAGEAGSSPLDAVLRKLGDIQQKLEPIGGTVGGIDPLDPATVGSIGQLVSAVKRDATALPPPVASVVTAIADGTARVARAGVSGTLQTRYTERVLRECTSVTTGRYPFVPTSDVDVPLADFGRLFGYGGVFESFFKEELQPLVDTSDASWTWRTDASGVSVGPSLAMLRQFEAAERIRETFFKPGSQEVELRFRITPTDLDAGATRFVLELDGQHFEYRHGPERKTGATWPGPAPGLAAISFEGRGVARPHRVFEGPWAWFRLIAAGQLEQQIDTQFVWRYQLDGHEARVRLDAATLRNPYATRDLQQFRCGSAS